eukprot:jgi/Galph1/3243/GphlegSOOS_G1885.1
MVEIPKIPPPRLCKRRARGLYDGEMTTFGEKSAPSGEKHRRSFRPNIHRLSLYSKTLNQWFRFRISQSAMQKVKAWGGLDEYLLRTPDQVILFPFAIRLKYEIKNIREQNIARSSDVAGVDGGLANIETLNKDSQVAEKGVVFNR